MSFCCPFVAATLVVVDANAAAAAACELATADKKKATTNKHNKYDVLLIRFGGEDVRLISFNRIELISLLIA